MVRVPFAIYSNNQKKARFITSTSITYGLHKHNHTAITCMRTHMQVYTQFEAPIGINLVYKCMCVCVCVCVGGGGGSMSSPPSGSPGQRL